MIALSQYIVNNYNSHDINENLAILPVLKKLGLLLLSSVVPYLISIGVKIASLKLDEWVNKIKTKYPQHKDAIDILIDVLKNHLGELKKCDLFISNSEKQNPSKLLTVDDIKREILPLISNKEDKEKVEDFLSLIDSDKFKEDIDECMNLCMANINERYYGPNTSVDFDKSDKRSKQKSFKLILDRQKYDLLISLLYCGSLDKYDNMTLKEFKEKYNKTINFHKDGSNYNSYLDLKRIYSDLSGELPKETEPPFPENFAIDIIAQTRRTPYWDVAKEEGILY